MNPKSLILATLLSLAGTPNIALASGSEYIGRCGIADPAVQILLTGKPNDLIRCRPAPTDSLPILYFDLPITLRVGAQVYALALSWSPHWASSCQKTLETFKASWGIPFRDAETGESFHLYRITADTIRIAAAATPRLCFGKRIP